MTLKEIIPLNLKREGPADGDCGEKDKWILLGDVFGLPSKCFCIDHPKGDGQFLELKFSNNIQANF